jgi:hypothetical protein
MRVIGVGIGRTGTLSTKVALETLGFGPCHHFTEIMGRADLARRWAGVLGSGTPDWPQIFAGYGATVDWPAAAYWRDLVDTYREAKVLLNVRDPDRWYESMLQTLLPPVYGDRPGLRQRARAGVMRVFQPGQAKLMVQLPDMLRAFFGTGHRMPTRQEAIDAYQRHVAEVRTSVDPDRLLIYQVSDGWDPLCEFLGVDRPDQPFPRVNEAASFRQDMDRFIRSARRAHRHS